MNDSRTGLNQDVINSVKVTCSKILELDKNIRFVGRIKDRKLLSFVRRNDSKPFLSEELANLSHYQISVKANMERMFDEALGNTNWMITSKDKVKLITVFLDDGLLILSTEPEADHDTIISEIQKMNTRL
ncbi:MAG TPA: hypothetical protein VLA53_05935 [Nitrosopumilaceae archaeon]|nr:hypothetical protein [Nitrosopumilaceae archaeon]